MKKLSLLISLILCVTIGGVYAAWTYAKVDEPISHDVSLAVGMEYTTAGSAGTFAIEIDQTLTPFEINPKTGTYEAELTAKNNIYLTFTPNENSTEDIIENGIDAYLYFNNGSAIANYKYLGTQIFTYELANGSENAVKISKIGTETEGAKFSKINISGVEKIAIDLTDFFIKDAIKLMDVELPTIDDFNEFKACLTNSGSPIIFGVTITNIDPKA